MTASELTLFDAFLNQHDSQAWKRVLDSLLASIHEVDRTATQIWFAFFPLDLAAALKEAEDPALLTEALLLLGQFELKDQIDTSHAFLYGHRYWPEVKRAVSAHAASSKAPSSLDLEANIKEVAHRAAGSLKIDVSLVLGITAVAFMTSQQVGAASFSASPGKVSLPARLASKSPEQVLKGRSKGDGQGLFGFLKGEQKTYPITFDETQPGSSFMLIAGQELTTAAAEDKEHFTQRDSRLLGSEGPIPVQCRAAACGTCWVGVLAGAEKLSDVDRIEALRIKEFGYIDTDDPKPLIRLACRAQGFGAVSVVIPPWNGIYGKYLKYRKEAKDSEQANQTA
jgi:ferredoxin